MNVSAVEGQFYRSTKTDKHPHTNMAKAALNMMTRTSAPDFVKDGIHMNAVDTGWVTDEDPAAHAARKAELRIRAAARHHRRRGAHRRSHIQRPAHRRACVGAVPEGLQAGTVVTQLRRMARFAVSTVAIAAASLLFGCAAPRPAPDGGPPPTVPRPATITPEAAPSPAPTPPVAAPAPAHAPPPAVTAPATAPASGATHSVPPGRPTAKPSVPAATQPKPATETPKAPTLDLGSLEQRLKDTKAIGVFTKLSLKNQVDDLLGELRAFHKGDGKTPAAALRQKYDTLIIKVLTLLQDGDPQLASAIASSREALWGILMDPQKFSQI